MQVPGYGRSHVPALLPARRPKDTSFVKTIRQPGSVANRSPNSTLRLRLTVCVSVLDDSGRWTPNKGSLKSSCWRVFSRLLTQDLCIRATSQQRIELTIKGMPITHGFGFGSVMVFAAEPSPVLKLGELES